MQSHWGLQFLPLNSEISRLQLKLANDDFTPDEEARVEAAFETAAQEHFDACPASEG